MKGNAKKAAQAAMLVSAMMVSVQGHAAQEGHDADAMLELLEKRTANGVTLVQVASNGSKTMKLQIPPMVKEVKGSTFKWGKVRIIERNAGEQGGHLMNDATLYVSCENQTAGFKPEAQEPLAGETVAYAAYVHWCEAKMSAQAQAQAQAQAAGIELETIAENDKTILRVQMPPLEKEVDGITLKTGFVRQIMRNAGEGGIHILNDMTMFVDCANQTAGFKADTQSDLLVDSAAYAVYQRWCEAK